jgi:hypothetical protein
LLKENYSTRVKSIPYKQTEREFLTFEEVKAVAKAECPYDTLKRAALFSIFTGLRFGDIRDLKWKEVRHSKANGHFLRLKVNKPNRPETLFISDQAREIMGEMGAPEENVFEGLKYGNHITPRINQWMQNAGIERHITFHAFRHTFATLQISFGTDIYVLKSCYRKRMCKPLRFMLVSWIRKRRRQLGVYQKYLLEKRNKNCHLPDINQDKYSKITKAKTNITLPSLHLTLNNYAHFHLFL